MTDGKVHGTDCFEVDSFLQRNEFSKLYQVRHKENGRFYTMEVSPRDGNSKAPVSPYVQLTKPLFSPFWVSMRFTFQTRAKFYYILDFAGKETLSERVKSLGGCVAESMARFYAAEIALALEEFHSACQAYKDLTLDMVHLDSEGHVVLWRNFCGKFYWSKHECVCSLGGFCHGDPCDNSHNLKSESDFKQDWKALGKVINVLLMGDDSMRASKERSLSSAASDLISRLERGDISRCDQIQSHLFFKDINWNEIKARKGRPPMNGDNRPTSFSSQTSSPANYSSVGANMNNGPSSFHQRHIVSHHSDPGDARYLKSAPDYLAPGVSLHSAVSTPDLRSLGRESPTLHHRTSLPARDFQYHYGNPDYANARARDFEPRPDRGVERRRILSSRSMSDLTSFDGKDGVFFSHSPASLQRTFVYPNYERAPNFTKPFQLPSDNPQEAYKGGYPLRSSGSSPDLTSSFGPPVFSPYYTPHSGRSSPTPSQYSDYSSYSSYSTEPSPRSGNTTPYQSPRSRYSDERLLPNENGSALGLPRWERSSPRESENHRESSDSPNAFRRGQSSLPYSESRAIDNLSSPSSIPTNKTSTQQRSFQESDVTTEHDTNRTSHDTGRERAPTLTRTRSLSNLGDEHKRSILNEVSDKRRDSLPLAVGGAREKYPLARVPIPSFREFKQKNLEEKTKNKSLIGKNEVRENLSEKSPRVDSKQESTRKAELRASLKERLSSLYESAKDISAQSATKRLGDSYALNASGKDSSGKIEKATIENSFVAKSAELTEAKPNNAGDGKKSEISRKISKSRLESPFSKNEVIHNLMLKYGLYEKSGQKKAKGPNGERKETVLRKDSSHANTLETNNKNETDPKSENSFFSSKRGVSPTEKERTTQEAENNLRNATESNRIASRPSPAPVRKSAVQGVPAESKKSAAERFRELRRQGGARNRTLETVNTRDKEKAAELNSTKNVSIKDAPALTKEGLKREDNDTGFFDKHNSGESRRNDLDSTAADIIRARSNVSGSRSTTADGSFESPKVVSDLYPSPGTPRKKKSSVTLRGTSRAILCATKFKRATNRASKTANSSPLPDKKQLEDVVSIGDTTAKVEGREQQSERHTDTIGVTRNESVEKRSPNNRRRRFRTDGRLRKGGIHTSMLSVASNACMTDSEMEDTVSIYSEVDSLGDERGTRGRRWESFYSNISADSGSAHLFEFETDSNATEFDGVFDDQESEDEHPKCEAEVERTDSGVGGDMGQSPLRRSWEEIVMKSSEHWSVVAASARHWQDLARRKKGNEGEATTVRKKSSVHSITEDMVECPDCLKHYVPPKEEEKGEVDANEPEICGKCKDRKVERKEAIIELVQTEINYGNDLQILKEEFYLPMQSGGILSPDHLAAIFLNLQELLEVNSKFCAKLQKSLEESVANGDEEFSKVNVGSIFLESVDFFQAYEIYCSKQTAASALLESLQKKTELLRIFLNVTCRENPKCRKMDLNSFILAPVQRIMKYPLLLSRICKASPRRNPDREKLKMAQRRIEEQLNKINALNTAVESRQKRYRASQQLGRSDSLDKLQMKKMASDILNWTMEEMQLLMHGVFQITIHEFGASWNRRSSKKAISVCALFCVRGHSEYVRIDSDDEGECEEPLFPGEGDVSDAAVVLLRKKINGKYTLFKEPLYLDMCVIYRDCDRKDAFEIMSIGKETYVFRASTSRESRRWLKYLRLEAKELGGWKRRRHGLPNIMIKNL